MREMAVARVSAEPTWLDRALLVFTEVRPGEGATGVALLASVFLLLATNYFLKPARDGLLAVSAVPGLSDLEVKAYSSFGQSLLLLGAMPLYGHLSARLRRRDLVTRVTLFFIASLLAFWALQPGLLVTGVPSIGVAFYLWIGVFNVFVICQFWSFAADLYSAESGRRLFPLIAVGAALGSTVGAWVAKELVASGTAGTWGLVLAAALLLGGSLGLMRFAEAREPDRSGPAEPPGISPGRAGALRLVFGHRYLLATALVLLLLNWVKTNSDNLLFAAVQEVLDDDVAARGLADPVEIDRFVSDRTTIFYGDLFFWINLSALCFQALIASRVLRYAGFGFLIAVLPVLSLVSYSALFAFPLLRLFRITKIAEDGINYSLNNTALQVLWLPTRRDMKYRAKAAIDTVCVRIGDGMAALTAFVGIHLLVLPVSAFFVVNAALAGAWCLLAVVIAREHRRLQAVGPPVTQSFG